MSVPIADNLIVQDGSVGIGTTTPAQKLEISGDAAANSLLKINSLEFQPYALNNAWFGENVYYDGGFLRRQTGSAGLFYFAGPEGQFRFAGSDDAGTSIPNNVQLKIANDGQFGIGSAIDNNPGNFTDSNFYVAADGNVGIGTTTLSQKLEVAGGAKFTGNDTFLTLNNAAGDYYQLNFSDHGGDVWHVGPYYPTSNNFQFYSQAAAATLLDIDVDTGMLLINSSQTGEKINMYNTATGYSIGVESNNFKFVMGYGVDDYITFNKGPYASSTEVMRVQADGKVGIGTAAPNNKLTVVGTLSTTDVVTLGNATANSTLQINGYANRGGTGYHDFISVTNTYASATTPTKFMRLNSAGALEVLNSQYSQGLLQLTNDGALNVYAASPAVVANNDALSGYIAFNNNSTQIYDDGNTHIHSRGNGSAMWINTNNAQLNLLTQAPVNGGAAGTGVAIGTGTLNGFVSINKSRSASITQPYGYLISSGAGSTAGTSPNNYSLTCSDRIQCPEFDASSDERLKENIVPVHLSDATNFVRGVSAITFNWKDAENPGKKSGFIAQQVMKAGFDHLISIVGNNDVQEQIDADGFVSPAGAAMVMNYDQAIPYHHEVIKHLLDRIEQLEKQLKELRGAT